MTHKKATNPPAVVVGYQESHFLTIGWMNRFRDYLHATPVATVFASSTIGRVGSLQIILEDTSFSCYTVLRKVDAVRLEYGRHRGV